MSTPKRPDSTLWHLLQVSDVLDLEFATALAASVPVVAWEPMRTWRALRVGAGEEQERVDATSGLRLRSLPLLPGYNRFPWNVISSLGPSVVDRLLRSTPDPRNSPLVCTIPYFASVAEMWPGPVVYWLTDLMAEYAGANRTQVIELDRRMCAAATLVCPNSERLKQYLMDFAGCAPERIEVVPNATGEISLLPAPPGAAPAENPALSGIPRPIVGVIGNLASNTDWLMLQALIERLPNFSWVFVGPTSMHMPDFRQREARGHVMRHARTFFVGPQPYATLASYARAFDVAMLPYKRCEPTYSGSSTRFYDHLAACRPMIATSGLEELTRKPPLLRLTDSVDAAAEALTELAAMNFDDGLIELRWRASLQNTWRSRANQVIGALAQRQGSPRRPQALKRA